MRSPWSTTRVMCFLFSGLALLTLLFMLGLFIWQSLPAWKHEGSGLLTGTKWFHRVHQFGSAPMLYGTLVVAGIALLLATPLGIGTAIFTSEYLPPRLRLAVKLVAELLAGVPSVVYGLIGMLVLRDWIYELLTPFDPLSGDTLLTAGVLLAVMILPTIMTLSEDALRSVPAAQRRAARGLGLNASEVVWHVSLPQAASGFLAAVLLALGRALGEAIAVFLVVGRQDNQWPKDLLSFLPVTEAGQTLGSKLGSAETTISYGDPVHWGAMVGLGLILLLLVITITWLSARLRPTDHAA